MQSASSRIWTRVAVSISYDDNHYTTGTSSTSNQLRSVNKNSSFDIQLVYSNDFSQGRSCSKTYIDIYICVCVCSVCVYFILVFIFIL